MTNHSDALKPNAEGIQMYGWARDLFPIHRSLTGPGVRETLAYLQRLLPLAVLSVPSGTPAFDWIVPDEWTLRDAYVLNEEGKRVIDVRLNNLHVLGYSTPVDAWLSRAELDAHLFSLPEQPTAIPYVTSYYARRWGFCLSHAERIALPEGRYRAVIDAELAPGIMNVGELVLPGDSSREVLFSANICHPSLANNEISGMVVLAALARWLMEQPQRRLTYRFVFLPETIGAVWYLSRHAEQMKAVTDAGFVACCIGDDRVYSYVASRLGGTLADRVALHVLRHRARGPVMRYSFLDRGSDERQYCSPGIDLPVCSVLRSKYGEYPEYHTSLDDLAVISPEGLQGGYDVLRACIEILEANLTYRTRMPCEPQLGRRGLYPSVSEKETIACVQDVLNVIAYADGSRDLVGLADTIGLDALQCRDMLQRLLDAGVVEIV